MEQNLHDEILPAAARVEEAMHQAMLILGRLATHENPTATWADIQGVAALILDEAVR